MISILTQDRLDQYAALVEDITKVLDRREKERTLTLLEDQHENAKRLYRRMRAALGLHGKGNKEFDPNQPRDEIGRWTDAGGVRFNIDPNNFLHNDIFKHAKDLGIPTSAIRVGNVSPSRDGMTGFETAATYNREDHTITLYPGGMSPVLMRGILAHENVHRLWTEYGGLQAVINAIKSKYGKSPIAVLSASDGVTEYSRLFWGGGDVALAIEETLGEVARLIADGRSGEVSEPWLVAYDALRATQR